MSEAANSNEPIRHALLDGRQRTRRAVMAKLARDLDFPKGPAPNLDALFDVLRTDIEGPFTITWRAGETARRALGADFGRLRAVLLDVARQRTDVKVMIED